MSFFVWSDSLLKGNTTYRKLGWRLFKSIEQHCKVPSGYSGVLDVAEEEPVPNNSQQSFWLAETLKYAWLLFAPTDAFSLDEMVFTTEAHPLMIIKEHTSAGGQWSTWFSTFHYNRKNYRDCAAEQKVHTKEDSEGMCISSPLACAQRDSFRPQGDQRGVYH